MSQTKTLTRRELYDLVWSKPMRKLAAELCVSDVGLAKICRRHRVPTPSRGYWAKVEAGKKVRQTTFFEVDDIQINRIEIRPGLMKLPDTAREIIEKAKTERKLVKSASRARGMVTSVTVPSPLQSVGATDPIQNVHEAVRKTAQVLRRGRVDKDGALQAVGDGLCGVVVGSRSAERVIAFLDALARRLEIKGLPIVQTGQGMKVSIGPDSATFAIKERTRREKHVPTPEELAAEARRQKKLQRRWSSASSWDDVSLSRAYPEFDVIHTGNLALQVEGYGDGVRRTWADGKTQTLEALLDDIVVGLEALLVVRKADREKREEQNRLWQELSRRRELARKRSEREETRKTYLDSILNLHREIEKLRAWLAELELSSHSVETDLARMVAWAKERLARLEATVAPENINKDLNAKDLFPATDELHDPLGDPPTDSRWW